MSIRLIRSVVDSLRRSFAPRRRFRRPAGWWILDRVFQLRRNLEELENRVVPATVTWTGAGDGTDWFDPANWDTGVPTFADDVSVPVAFNTSTIEIPFGLAEALTLDTYAGVMVNTGGVLSIASTTLPSDFHGQFVMNSGTLVAEAEVRFHGDATVAGVFSGGGDFTSFAKFEIGGNTTLPGAMRSEGTFHILSDTTIVPNGATLELSGTATLEGNALLQLDGLLDNNSNFRILRSLNGAAIQGTGTIANPGNLLQDAPVSTTIDVAIDNTGEVYVTSGGELTLTGAITQLAGSTLTGGHWSVEGVLDISSPVVTVASGVVIYLRGPQADFVNLTNLTLAGGFINISEGAGFNPVGSVVLDSGDLTIDARSKLHLNDFETFTQNGGYLEAEGELSASSINFLAGTTVYGNPVSIPDVVGAWRGEVNADDFTGNHNGTQQNSAANSFDGKIGYALQFDGADDYITAADDFALRPTSFTVSAWVNATAFSAGSNVIVAKGGSAADLGSNATFELRLNNGVPQLRTYHLSGESILDFGSALNVGEWYHLAAICDGISAVLFVNGAAVSNSPFSPLSYDLNPVPLTIGAGYDSDVDVNHFHGRLDEVMLFNRALGDVEIEMLRNAPFVTYSGTIHAPSGRYSGSVTVDGTASLAGSGFITSSLVNAGVVAPGNSPGVIVIDGDYTQTAAGTLEIEIDGPNPGIPEFDYLIVNGDVALAGALTIQLGYVPTSGQTFTIIQNNGIEGVFGEFDDLPEGHAWLDGAFAFYITYQGGDGNDVVLTAYPAIIVTNTADGGPGSLRQAIEDSDTDGGPTFIGFNIPGGGVQTITPATAYPDIPGGTILDATTQPGYTPTTPMIVLDGFNGGSPVDGLTLSGGESTVRGFVISRFGNYGIEIVGSSFNRIVGNYIGTDENATDLGVSGSGILIVASESNTIGGYRAADRNFIGFNSGFGIRILNGGSDGNLVVGNYIGVGPDGTTDIGNSGEGVLIDTGARFNIIGGGKAGAGNVISYNDFGIAITGAGTEFNKIQGNRIGTDAAGALAAPNTGPGITIDQAAADNIIGTDDDSTDDATEGNLISGNDSHGILVGSASDRTIIAGNLIGLDALGINSIPNGEDGINVDSSNAVRIGGSTNASRNVIGNNLGNGIQFSSSDLGEIDGNFIGTDVTGQSTLGNGGDGIYLHTESSSNTILNNVVMGNFGQGIQIAGSLSTFNTIEDNYIGTNEKSVLQSGNLGHGVYINNAPANIIRNNYVSGNAIDGINVAGADSSGNTIEGNTIGLDTNGGLPFISESFEYAEGVDVAGLNGGVGWAGAWTGFSTNPDPGWTVESRLQNENLGTKGASAVEDVTFDGNDGNRRLYDSTVYSDMLAAGGWWFSFLFISDGVFQVNPFSGGGGINFPYQIEFNNGNVVLTGDGVASGTTFAPAAYTPGDPTFVLGRIVIDGLDDGNNDFLQIYVNPPAGQYPPNGALKINAIIDYTTIATPGITYQAKTPGATNTFDEYRIHTVVPGMLGNGGSGITITDGASSNNVIGLNVVSGNTNGITVQGVGTDNNLIAGNYIGTDSTGTLSYSWTSGDGILLQNGSSGTFVGGVNGADRNVISGNFRGIYADGSENNVVIGNSIGTDATGAYSIANQHGIELNASLNRIGTDGDGTDDEFEGNLISGNIITGVFITGGGDNIVAGNFIGTTIDGTGRSRMRTASSSPAAWATPSERTAPTTPSTRTSGTSSPATRVAASRWKTET